MDDRSQVDPCGKVRMVDVGEKPPVRRMARAAGTIRLCEEARARIAHGALPKGDVLATAQIAGIQAAKRTSELIPLCHPLVLDHVEVRLEVTAEGVAAESAVRCVGRTGVEMEALVAVSVALLTVYDMCKSVDPAMSIGPVRLLEKAKSDAGSL